MLQKVSSGSDKRILCFRNIHPDSTGEGICFVRGGQHKFTKADKPFVVLYLQDSDKTVIPGYIFDLQNFQQSGAELTKVTRHIVRIKYRENYLPRYGMTVILDKVEIVENPSQEFLYRQQLERRSTIHCLCRLCLISWACVLQLL